MLLVSLQYESARSPARWCNHRQRQLRFFHIWVSTFLFWSHFAGDCGSVGMRARPQRRQEHADKKKNALVLSFDSTVLVAHGNSLVKALNYKVPCFKKKNKQKKTPLYPVNIESWVSKIAGTYFYVLPSARKRYKTCKLFRSFLRQSVYYFWSKLNVSVSSL